MTVVFPDGVFEVEIGVSVAVGKVVAVDFAVDELVETNAETLNVVCVNGLFLLRRTSRYSSGFGEVGNARLLDAVPIVLDDVF